MERAAPGRKKNRFLLAVVVLIRQSAAAARALDQPAPQVLIEARLIKTSDRFVREIGASVTLAPSVLGTDSVAFPPDSCTRLFGNDVAPPARWLVGPPDPIGGVTADAVAVLELAPRVVCSNDADARIEPAALVSPTALPGTACSGLFLPYDPTEALFQLSCSTIGSGQATGFAVQLPGNRQISAFLSPTGFACTVTTATAPKDTLSCTGAVRPGVTYSGHVRMSPGPAAGMGGQLYALENGGQAGPFPIAGP